RLTAATLKAGSTPETMNSIASNLERVRSQIADACTGAKRDPGEVALMAVSKTQPAEAIAAAWAAGQRLFGENRVQEWQSKLPQLALLLGQKASPAEDAGSGDSTTAALTPPGGPDPASGISLAVAEPTTGLPLCIHLIGPLQNNKTARGAAIFDAVDTLDSLKTAERLNAAARALGKTLRVFLEVKLSPEATKRGLAPEELPGLLAALQPLRQINVRGLMTVPPWSQDPETARPYFRRLRQLRDENLDLCPTLTELSMGMSGDFVVAIEEGSTMVRLGTAIFGRRSYP
ncbi:MAG: YggS family pyridoxal phosphate-dependent enzyme, partial [Acidobacteriota bacterium]